MRIRVAPGPLAALIAKDLAVLTGRPGLWLVRTGFVALLFAAIAVAWLAVGENPVDPARLPALGRTIESVLGIAGVLLSSVAVSLMSVETVAEERARGALDILRSAPISDFRIMASHFASSLIAGGGFLLGAMPLFAVPLFLGGISPTDIGLWIILPCFVSSAASAALGVNFAFREKASPGLCVALGAIPPIYLCAVVLCAARLPLDPGFLLMLACFCIPLILTRIILAGRRGKKSAQEPSHPTARRRPALPRFARWKVGSALPSRGIGRALYRLSHGNAFVVRAMLRQPLVDGGAILGLSMLISGMAFACFGSFAAVTEGDPSLVGKASVFPWMTGFLAWIAPLEIAAYGGFGILDYNRDAPRREALLSTPLRGRDVVLGGLAASAYRGRVAALSVGVLALVAGLLSVRPLLPVAAIAFVCAAFVLAFGVALWVRLLIPGTGPAASMTLVILVVPVVGWFLAAPALPTALRVQSWFALKPRIEAGMAFAAGLAGLAATGLLAGFEAHFDRAMGRPAAGGARP
ncbi:MAG: hypothetical protein JXP34_03020 [Planctomycetes bacterium]|nr:hypothetical protein [Planctomycetota bacterium]